MYIRVKRYTMNVVNVKGAKGKIFYHSSRLVIQLLICSSEHFAIYTVFNRTKRHVGLQLYNKSFERVTARIPILIT